MPLQHYTVTVAETLTVTVSVTTPAVHIASASETVTVSSTAAALLLVPLALSESAGAVGESNVNKTSFVVGASSPVSLAESIQAQKAVQLAASDNAGGSSESLNVLGRFIINPASTASLAEAAAAMAKANVLTSQSSGAISESQSNLVHFKAPIGSVVGVIGESLSADAGNKIGISEVYSLLDGALVMANQVVNVADGIPVQEQLGSAARWHIGAAEVPIALSDGNHVGGALAADVNVSEYGSMFFFDSTVVEGNAFISASEGYPDVESADIMANVQNQVDEAIPDAEDAQLDLLMYSTVEETVDSDEAVDVSWGSIVDVQDDDIGVDQAIDTRISKPPVVHSALLGGPGTIYVGSRIRMSARFTDSDGALYDPATVTMLFIAPPTNSPFKHTYFWPPTAVGSIVRRSLGVFYVEWLVLLPGKYSFAWQSTSAGEEQYDEASFTAVARTIII